MNISQFKTGLTGRGIAIPPGFTKKLENESYLAPWGDILRIDEIQTYRKVSDRPFCDEMSDAEKEEIRKYSEDMGLPYEFIRFSRSI